MHGARWAHMHHFLSVCLSVTKKIRLEKNHILKREKARKLEPFLLYKCVTLLRPWIRADQGGLKKPFLTLGPFAA